MHITMYRDTRYHTPLTDFQSSIASQLKEWWRRNSGVVPAASSRSFRQRID